MPALHRVNYVTSSHWKREENATFVEVAEFEDGTRVKDWFTFEIRELQIPEMLLVDIRDMVQAEAFQAYLRLKVPCIVEHAGLLFEGFEATNYPGGLTKPMWNALGRDFVRETNSENRRAIARAVVAYCDGKCVRTFVGETWGTLAPEARGERDFYWDNVFMPDSEDPRIFGKTYSEIVEDPELGLEYKIKFLSQSSKAMLKCLEHLRSEGTPDLWR